MDAPFPDIDWVLVPDFTGMQALNAWLRGWDCGLLLAGPDPDGPSQLDQGVVSRQRPGPGTKVPRWTSVTVWTARGPEGGVREPRRPVPPMDAQGVSLEAPN